MLVEWAGLTYRAVSTCRLGVGQESSQQEDGGKQLSPAHHTCDLTREEAVLLELVENSDCSQLYGIDAERNSINKLNR